MANLVETIIDRIKIPDKIELSQTDRQLLQKLAASVEELKQQKAVTESQFAEAEKRLGNQMQDMLKEIQKAPEKSEESPVPPEIALDFSELRHFISEENEQSRYQTKALIEEKNQSVTSQLQSIKTAVKDDEILSKLPTLFSQLCETEANLQRQIRTTKIMMGFTIWISLLSLAAIAANILGFI